MKNKIIILAIAICMGVGAKAQEVAYTNATEFPLYGKISNETNMRYERRPAKLEGVSRKDVWRLGRNSAGLYIRFCSNTTSVRIKWESLFEHKENHMSDLATRGMDLYALVDGESIDPWIISKPKAKQKLFVGRNPFMFKITLSRKLLKEAFLSESAMGAFISVVFGKVRNMIEASYEDLARTARGSSIASVRSQQRIMLGTMYRNETGSTLNANALLHDRDFLNWATGKINLYSDYLTDMTALYNDTTTETFSPKEDQRLIVLSSFERSLETVSQWAAFHDKYVKLNNYETVNFWQAPDAPMDIKTKNLETGADYNGSRIVAVLFDRDALGVYQKEEEVLTTPVNARGLYYNTFYHIMKNMYFDRSENFLAFNLN